MLTMIKNFRADESGAVTVDWVVLTAAIVGLGVAAIGFVSKGINNLGSQVQTELSKTGADSIVGTGVTDATS